MTNDDDDLLPKKLTSVGKSPARSSSKSRAVSPPMRRLMRITRALGLVFGGFVSLVGLMSLVGLATDNFWARLLVALIVVIGLPAFLSDRILKRTNVSGGLPMVSDIFAIVLLGIALLLVAVNFVSKPLLVREGDRYARSGSRTMARVVYFLGGASPVFPDDQTAGVSAPTSASASGVGPEAGVSDAK